MSLSEESVRPGARSIPYIMFTNDDVETTTLTSKGKSTMVGTSNSSNNRTSHTSAATGNSSKLCSLGYDVDDTDDMDDVYYDCSVNRNNNKSNNNTKISSTNANKNKTNRSKNNKKDVASSENSVKRNSNGYKVKRVIFPLIASYESEFMRACLQGLLTYPGFESSLLGKRCDPKSTCKTVGKEKSNVPVSSTINGSTPSLQTELSNDNTTNNRVSAMKGTLNKMGQLISLNHLTHSHSNVNDEVGDNNKDNSEEQHVVSLQHEHNRAQYEEYHTKHEKEEEEDEEPTTSLLMYGNEQLEEEEELHLQSPVHLESASTRHGDVRDNHALLELSQENENEQEEKRQQNQEQQSHKLSKEQQSYLVEEEEEEEQNLLGQQREMEYEGQERHAEQQLASQEKNKGQNASLQCGKQLQSVHLESGCGWTTNVVSLNITHEAKDNQSKYENIDNSNMSAKQNDNGGGSDNKNKQGANVTVNKFIAKCKEAMIVSRSDLSSETNLVSTFTNNAVESLHIKRVANERKYLPYAQMTDFASGNLFTSASLATNPTSPSSLIVREIDGGIRNHWGTQITTHASMCYRDYVLQSQAWLKRLAHVNSGTTSSSNNSNNNNNNNKGTDATCHLELSSNVSTNSATPNASVHLQCVPVGSAEMDIAIRNEANYGTTDLQRIYFAPVNAPQLTQWNVQHVCNDELMEEEEDYDSWSSNHIKCMPTFPFPQLTSFVLVHLVEYLVRRSAMELNEFETIDICTEVLGPASSVKDASPEAQQRMIQRAKRLLLAASFLQMEA